MLLGSPDRPGHYPRSGKNVEILCTLNLIGRLIQSP